MGIRYYKGANLAKNSPRMTQIRTDYIIKSCSVAHKVYVNLCNRCYPVVKISAFQFYFRNNPFLCRVSSK